MKSPPLRREPAGLHLPALARDFSVSTKHLYNIYTMLDQRRRRWADVV